jgi:hypothetical protein
MDNSGLSHYPFKKGETMDLNEYPKYIFFPSKLSREPGALSVAQEPSLPFLPKRIYWTYNVPEETKRGGHAHKTLWQVLVCVHGSIIVHADDGKGWYKAVTLDDPAKGLLLPPPFWHTMTFMRSDSVLLAIASDVYDESDYIRDYEEFLLTRKLIERKKSPGTAPAIDESTGVRL